MGTLRKTQNPRNVSEAVAHLRRQLNLSLEKFAAKVGCSFQTVLRWESGRAKIAEGNLVRLWELARDYDPLAERIFASETLSYRRLLESNSAADARAMNHLREEVLNVVQNQIREIDYVSELISTRQAKKAKAHLSLMRDRLGELIVELQTSESQKGRNTS